MSIDASAIPDMIQWYEGMLLMPEHFQSANRRQEMLGGYLAQACAPYPWGVRSLAIDLLDGVLHVRKLEAVLPDGLVVRHVEGDPETTTLDINLKRNSAAIVPNRKFTVHLIVPAWSDHLVAQEGAEAGALVRYHSVRGARLGRDDPDRGPADPAVERMHERPWLRPILRLYVTDGPLEPPPDKYVGIPIARVFVDAGSEFQLDRYEPPRLSVTKGDELLACARNVANELRSKARMLDDRLQREDALPDRGDSEAASSWEMMVRLLTRRFHGLKRNIDNIQALVRNVPRLEALTKDACTHPFALYLALCDVVGDMALLGGELNLPDIPAYAHADALASFDFLQRHIRTMAESLDQRYRVFVFERVMSGRFELAFDMRKLPATFILGVVRAKGAAASPVREWMQRAAITTDDQRPDTKKHRTGGAARHAIDRDESLGLIAPSMTSLFRVEPNADTIDPRGTVLVVENASGEAPIAVLLYLPNEVEPAPRTKGGKAAARSASDAASQEDVAVPPRS